MKITNITYKTNKELITITADVQFADGRRAQPYFSVPAEFAHFIAKDASAFLAAYLIPCMKRRENIIVDATVSQQFLCNTQEIINLLVDWDINLHRIDIVAKRVEKDRFSVSDVACFFSAGVDSFYTYLKNKKSKRKKIKYFIFVHGLDIELENKALHTQTLTNIQSVAKQERVKVVPVETNIKPLIEHDVLWDFGHGGALGAVALLLRRRFKTVYIAGSVSQDVVFPYGTHPLLDPLWGAEKLTIIHDGTEYNRVDKITKVIGKSALALRFLRVCSVNTKNTYNCGNCFKCLRTMIQLLCVTTLDKAKTFPSEIDLDKVKKMYYDYSLLYEREGYAVLKKLKSKRRLPELQKAVLYSIEKSRSLGVRKRMTSLLARLDQTYNNRRFYRYVFKMTADRDRSMLFKALFRLGIIK